MDGCGRVGGFVEEGGWWVGADGWKDADPEEVGRGGMACTDNGGN